MNIGLNASIFTLVFCSSNLDRFSLELKEDNDLFKWPYTQEIVVKIFESVG